MPKLLSPYDVEQQLERELAAVTDAQERAILAAWALAWSEISGDLFDTLLDLMADGARITAATVVRAERLARTLASVADTIEDLADRAGVTITSDLDQVLDQAIDATRRLIGVQLDSGRDLPERRPSRSALDAIVERVTEQVTSTLLPIADETYATIQRELIRGVAVGDSPRETARRMVERSEDLWNFGASRALNVSRTETLDAYRAGGQAAEDQHADILAGWTWLAHLGPKTCRSCLAMHGQLFPLDKAGPEDHQQGRCSRCPVVKGEDGEPDLSWVPSAAEHFDSLTRQEQIAILGREGYAAWAAGDFPIEEWTKTRSTPDWRDSQVPASPGDASGGSGRGSGTGGQQPPTGSGDEPVSIGEMLTLPKDPVVRDRAAHDIGLIDQVHLVPPGLQDVDVLKMHDFWINLKPGVQGFYINKNGIGPELQLRTDTGRIDITMVHELGHMLDDLVFGDGLGDQGMGTETYLDTEFSDWFDAVTGTAEYRLLQEMLAHSLAPAGNWSRVALLDGDVRTWDPDMDHVIYLMRPAELFGRAYAQWIAYETGDSTLVLQIARELLQMPDGVTLLQGQIPGYPGQWAPGEFAAIAEAMRRLFEGRGLLTGDRDD